jgi:DNA-binding MarR family transcriptional regulator
MGEKEAIRIGDSFEGEFSPAQASATECHVNLVRAGLLAEARVAEVLRPFGLNGSVFNVLMILGKAGEPLSPCVISDRMVVPRNTLTHILDVLERQELVQRERHPHHRGMVLVELTERGDAVLAEILPRLHALEAELWSSFSEEERQMLVSLLARAQEAFAGKQKRCEQRAS